MLAADINEDGLSKLPDEESTSSRLGFLVGDIVVPDDFDRMGESEIAGLFEPKAS